MFIYLPLFLNWEFQCESCSLSRPVAESGQRSAHFFCRQRAAVKAEAMTFFSSSESVTENPGQIFRRNADAVINNRYFNAIISIGIPAENLTRIFSHGFTTRKEGHGFGLHSGALAAKEMGGTLAAFSEGPGRGATFTLELTVQKQR